MNIDKRSPFSTSGLSDDERRELENDREEVLKAFDRAAARMRKGQLLRGLLLGITVVAGIFLSGEPWAKPAASSVLSLRDAVGLVRGTSSDLGEDIVIQLRSNDVPEAYNIGESAYLRFEGKEYEVPTYSWITFLTLDGRKILFQRADGELKFGHPFR